MSDSQSFTQETLARIEESAMWHGINIASRMTASTVDIEDYIFDLFNYRHRLITASVHSQTFNGELIKLLIVEVDEAIALMAARHPELTVKSRNAFYS